MRPLPNSFSPVFTSIVSALVLSSLIPTTVLAWGPENGTADGGTEILHKTREDDLIGRWEAVYYSSRESDNPVIDISKCGDRLCITNVDASGSCSRLIMSIKENKGAPDITKDGDKWLRFSGRITWSGENYLATVDVLNKNGPRSNEHPSKNESIVQITGDLTSKRKRDEWEGRGYPLDLGFSYKGPPSCTPSS